MAALRTDHATIARGLSEAFPELGAVVVTKTLGTGFNSIAVETNSGLVFRIARTEGTAVRFEIETRLLPLLRASVPVAVPEPQWFAPQTSHFPLGVIGYPKISGRTLQPDLINEGNLPALAAQTARFLIALHDVPVSEVSEAGLPQPEATFAQYRALAGETRPVLKARVTPVEFGRIDRWWEAFLADERMKRFKPAVTHVDFWYENLIVDEDAARIVGVVDWEHAAIGDRAQDLATQNLGSVFTEAVLRAYRELGGRLDDEDRYRIRRLWELRHFFGVLYGIRFNDEEEIVDSIRKLREGSVLTPSDSP